MSSDNEEYNHFSPPGPEDFEEQPPKPLGPLSLFPAKKYIKVPLVVFITFYIASAILSKYAIGEYLWVSGETVLQKYQLWRLFTALLVHKDMVHLLSNGWLFIIFGWMLRAYFGFLVFPVLTFAIGIITNLIVILLYDPHIRLIGASGMDYGMIALWLVFYIRFDEDRTIPKRFLRAVGFAIVMLFPTTFDPQTSYLAHGVGFLVGIALGLASLPKVTVREPRVSTPNFEK